MRSSPFLLKLWTFKFEIANAKKWLDCLKGSGYRITSPRRVVVDALANSERALNAAEILDIA